MMEKDGEEDSAVINFRRYLRINTSHPQPDYEECKEFLLGQAEELGIPSSVLYTSPKSPFVIMTIPGSKPELESLVLYSHTDVVPASKEHWKFDPFGAHKDEKGMIYGRGAQDMKSVGIQYLEAIRRHFKRGKRQWKRTIHLVWAPDEEISGEHGMKAFCETKEFEELNIGFFLDEGSAEVGEKFRTFYAEKAMWQVKITCNGTPGHGCVIMDNTAGEKMSSLLNSVFEFRAEQRRQMLEEKKALGDVVAINLTKIEGGTQTNVVPESLSAWFDIRIPPFLDLKAFEDLLKNWCSKAGPNVSLEFLQKTLTIAVTPTTAEDPWWAAFEGSLKEEGFEFSKEVIPARTDAGFVRLKGIRAIGFSPMNRTPVLLHAHNECLHEDVFLRGITVYERIIDRLADV